MNNPTMNVTGMQELTMQDIEDVSGGVLCVLVIAFAVGYGVGTAIYKAL